MALIRQAQEAVRDERLRAEWLSIYPLMSSGRYGYISYADYRARRTGANIDRRPAGEILAEVAEIEAQLRGGADDGI